VKRVTVHGAGPAGCAAAIAARLAGAEVDLYDPSPFPRHRVCGEFLSPEALPILESLGVAGAVMAKSPPRYTELTLRFCERTVRSPLAGAGLGISRYSLDELLLNRAQELGAVWRRERATALPGEPAILAKGRQGAAQAPPRGKRTFGFKAHCKGVPLEPLTLFFSRNAYVGISAVEGGAVNVCGLAREEDLTRVDFDIDAFIGKIRGLPDLLSPLTRQMPWMTTGPLVYDQRFQTLDPYWYPAGDALGFVDPFTGSGILRALLTGQLAGHCAAEGRPAQDYLDLCRRSLTLSFRMASFFRAVLATQAAGPLASLIPARWLMWATRPSVPRISKI
jgi:hypothetical protein